MPLSAYFREVSSALASGVATEHTYRPALQKLFEEVTSLQIRNEPQRSAHGAPDFVFLS